MRFCECLFEADPCSRSSDKHQNGLPLMNVCGLPVPSRETLDHLGECELHSNDEGEDMGMGRKLHQRGHNNTGKTTEDEFPAAVTTSQNPPKKRKKQTLLQLRSGSY